MQYEIVIKVITYLHSSDILSYENVLSCLCETLSMAKLVLGKKTSSSFLAFDFVCSARSFVFFPSPPQQPMTSDVEGFSIADFILILQK